MKLRRRDGAETELPSTGEYLVQPGEAIVSEGCGGGGYGDPRERDPQLVLRDYREGWISDERVSEVYGVVVSGEGPRMTVDENATAARRKELGAA